MLSKADRTRKFIIEKTSPIFNAKGYAGTSMNDITEATGLTKGSVYGNFENKDELALEAFNHNFGIIVSHIRLKMSEKKGAVERLLVYPEIYRHFLKLPFLKEGCPLLNTAMEADDTHPALRQKAVDAHKLWRTSLENLVNTGIKKGEIKKNIHPKETAAVIMSLVEGAVMQAKLTGKSTELGITMDYLEKFIRSLKT